MSTIPRISRERPSGTPGARRTAPGITSAIQESLSAAGELTGIISKRFAKQEREEALKLRDIAEAKQAVVNQVDAGKRLGDFEEDLAGVGEFIREQFSNRPEMAVDELTKIARELIKTEEELSPNTAVGLQVVRGAVSKTDTIIRQMREWVVGRQTQKAKNDLGILINQTTRGAESLVSVDALEAYLAEKEKGLSPLFDNVFGVKSGEEMAKMKSDSSQAFLNVFGDRNPLEGLSLLDAKSGPLVDNLDARQREAARKDLRSSFEGIGRQRDRDLLRESINGGNETVRDLETGALDARLVRRRRKALAKKKKVAEVDSRFTPEQRKSHIATIEKEEKILAAADRARRRWLAFEAEDEIGLVSELLRQQEDLFKKSNNEKGKDLAKWLDHQVNLAEAYGNKNISQGSFNQMYKAAALTLDAALKNESKNTGWNFLIDFRSPRQVGNTVINKRLNTAEFRNTTSEQQARIRVTYIQKLNNAQESGEEITDAKAKRFALEALSLETGTSIPGVF